MPVAALPLEPAPLDEFPLPSGTPFTSSAIATNTLALYIGSLRNDNTVHNAIWTSSSFSVPFPAAAGKMKNPPPATYYRAVVTLPFNCPVREATSTAPGHRSKALAKQSAAWHVVRQLVDMGEITERVAGQLVPTPKNPTMRAPKPEKADEEKAAGMARRLERGRLQSEETCEGSSSSAAALPLEPAWVTSTAVNHAEALDALPDRVVGETGVLGVNGYPMLVHPTFYASSPPLTPSNLHPTVLALVLRNHPTRTAQCRQMLLLTSYPLPIIPSSRPIIDIDISAPDVGVPAHFTLQRARKMKTFDTGQIESLFRYSRRFFRAALNKSLEGALGDTRYLVAPLRSNFTLELNDDDALPKVQRRDIAWHEVALADGPLTVPLDMDVDAAELAAELTDAVVTDGQEFGRRFYVEKVRPDLSPSSSSVVDGLSILQNAFSKEHNRYRYNGRTGIVFSRQPILECEHVVSAKERGFVAATALPAHHNWLIAPELHELHFLPASVMRVATCLPLALNTLDDLLIADELNARFFAHKLDPALALEALTSPAVHQLQRAAGFVDTPATRRSYERLEMLGDTVLKLLATIHVYRQTAHDEGRMTHERHLVVSNRALQAFAIRAGIVPFIRSARRKPREFCPPGWTLDTGNKDAFKPPPPALIGDKTIADVVEALLAAAYLSSPTPMQAALDAAHVLYIPIFLRQWDELATEPAADEYADVPLPLRPKPIELLGYTFRDRRLADVVLRVDHDIQRRAQFERYEFLGDALIDYFTVESIWLEHPELGPASMTIMKHSRVSNGAFSAFLIHSGLHERLTNLDELAASTIASFAANVTAAKEAADAAIARGDADIEYWNEVVQHKWLGDTFEALIGAILIDSGFDLPVLRAIYATQLAPFIEPYACPPNERSLHPKSVLLVTLAARGCRGWEVTKRPEGDKHRTDIYIHGRHAASALADTGSLATRKACEDLNGRIARDGVLNQWCDCPRKKGKSV
ncbi:hypothetical protein Q5752_005406 [Cryptotrichosporon argae]